MMANSHKSVSHDTFAPAPKDGLVRQSVVVHLVTPYYAIPAAKTLLLKPW